MISRPTNIQARKALIRLGAYIKSTYVLALNLCSDKL